MADTHRNPASKILDELCFVQAPLLNANRSLIPVASPHDLTACSIPVFEGQRAFKFAAPYFVRALGPTRLGSAWSTFCGLLRTRGIPLFSSVQALDKVPVADVPARWGIRFADEPINANDLKTADAFELGCHDRAQRNWRWPAEVSPLQVEPFVFATRMAAGADTPIGVSLPLGCQSADMQQCISANVDFINLIARFPRLDACDINSLVVCRQLVEKSPRPNLPILVTAPIGDIEHAHKLLMLGATAVCLDDLLTPFIPNSLASGPLQATGSGMLAGISSPHSRKAVDLPELATALGDYQQILQDRMGSVGARSLAEFNASCLRSVSEQCHKVTGVATLTSPK